MSLLALTFLLLTAFAGEVSGQGGNPQTAGNALPARIPARRAVILKVDGLQSDLLVSFVQERDPYTGKSRLPFIAKIFFEEGTLVKSFYIRSPTISVPSWQMLDTGQHLVIRGNVEFDRYTLKAYDYLSLPSFYLSSARSKSVDMPNVEVLDNVGVPLIIDRFASSERYQGAQIFQRGVRWKSIESSLRKRLTSQSPWQLFNEWMSGMDLRNIVTEQVERELLAKLEDEKLVYLDIFTPEIDHVAHLDNSRDSQYAKLKELDQLVGRIQQGIEQSSLARETVFVMVSDHGMNSSPERFSQGFDLVSFLGSAAGGGHHVLTNRHPSETYKLRGLDPFVSHVITPSQESTYLKGQHEDYPTALMDTDGNERASIYLRANTLNRVHLLLRELRRKDLTAKWRLEFQDMLVREVQDHRDVWIQTAQEMDEELHGVSDAIARDQAEVASSPTKDSEENRRREVRIQDWVKALDSYRAYRKTLLNLSSLDVKRLQPEKFRIEDYVPPRAMGDRNTIHDLQNYVVGMKDGVFLTINYLAAFSMVRTRNNAQEHVSNRPVDFVAVRVPRESLVELVSEDAPPATCGDAGAMEDGVWLYGSEQQQALILRAGACLRYLPVAGLTQGADGTLRFSRPGWTSGFPLHIWEDPALVAFTDRAAWLGTWHSEREWLRATHQTHYSNAVIALTEYFTHKTAPNGDLVARFEFRRRLNVEADLLLVASDGWNFNVRAFNPGGNHGSFFRASTHSTLLFSGGSVPRGMVIEEPYDSLSFAPTLLRLVGRQEDGLPGPPIEELFGRSNNTDPSDP